MMFLHTLTSYVTVATLLAASFRVFPAPLEVCPMSKQVQAEVTHTCCNPPVAIEEISPAGASPVFSQSMLCCDLRDGQQGVPSALTAAPVPPENRQVGAQGSEISLASRPQRCESTARLQPELPVSYRGPPLYTRNCSFLI